ncbi:hypothetical protein RclHR1_38770002 [Rhizophagus clarus]|uniref:Uncharacterized protein n=1 Tax=Rhizophagus clarus TaxID=94130 RepID=A0A2Z6RQK6_9GLOM|nr:hypothetical protein RclHR1_38770002 [Rhizophagus clarus]GET03055.1 hypothetical protein RCL_e16877_RclHR1_38770002 [Rhizophagus clarus]
MVSIIPSGLNNEKMPEKTLNIGKCHSCQEEQPFLEKYSIQGKSFLCCQSCNINPKDNEKICERCHKSALCTNEWDIYHGFNSYCSIIEDICFINDGHHTHRICFECQQRIEKKRCTKSQKIQVQLQKKEEIINRAKTYIWSKCDMEIERAVVQRNVELTRDLGILDNNHPNYQNHCENCGTL